MNIKIKNNKYLKEVKICSYNNFEDKRGIIWTSFKRMGRKVITRKELILFMINLIYQKKMSKGHSWRPNTYKLISCVYGKIFQVVVDCRINSKNFGKHNI